MPCWMLRDSVLPYILPSHHVLPFLQFASVLAHESAMPERHRDRLFDTSTGQLLWAGHSVKVEPLRVKGHKVPSADAVAENHFKRSVSPQ